MLLLYWLFLFGLEMCDCESRALEKLKLLWGSQLGKACVGRNSRFCEVQVDLTPLPDNLLFPLLHQAVDKCAARSTV